MTITEFLEARIAEDEGRAQAVLATVAPDEWENPTRWGNFFPEDVAFWDSQTPARVLAECAAKLDILKHCERLEERCDDMNAWNVREYDDIRHRLAAVYADHPEYKAEWAL